MNTSKNIFNNDGIDPCSLFIVVDENQNVEDFEICVLPKEMIVGTNDSTLYFFSSLDDQYTKFKDKHLRDHKLFELPEKSFIRYDIRDINNIDFHHTRTIHDFPIDYSLLKGFIQHDLLPYEIRNKADQISFRDEYITRELKKTALSEDGFYDTKFDFTKENILRYKNIPAVTEKQIKIFYDAHIYGDDITNYKKEIEATRETQYYKINRIIENRSPIEFGKVFLLDILLAEANGKHDDSLYLNKLYHLQNYNTRKIDIVEDKKFITKQLETLIFALPFDPDEIKRDEDLDDLLFKFTRDQVKGSLNPIIEDFFSNYKTFARLCEDKRTLQQSHYTHEKTSTRFSYDKYDQLYIRLLIDKISLLEAQLEFNPIHKEWFNNILASYQFINIKSIDNHAAHLDKLKALRQKCAPELNYSNLIDIEVMTDKSFFDSVQKDLDKIINNRITLLDINTGLNSNCTDRENVTACFNYILSMHKSITKVNYPVFHGQFYLNKEYAELNCADLCCLINDYINDTGLSGEWYYFLAEEQKSKVKIDMYISNVDKNGKMIQSPVRILNMEENFYLLKKEYFIPVIPQTIDTVKKNLKTYLKNETEIASLKNRKINTKLKK